MIATIGQNDTRYRHVKFPTIVGNPRILIRKILVQIFQLGGGSGMEGGNKQKNAQIF